jgi:hypothetical protein
MNERCPSCGYCPHCGRSNATPYYYPWPIAPYLTPTWTTTTAGGNSPTLGLHDQPPTDQESP